MRPIFCNRIRYTRHFVSATLSQPMKPYSEYSAEELAMERLFIRWVRHPDDPYVSKFWVNWVQENPQQFETVESAKMLVDTVSDWEGTELPREDRVSLWALIREPIGNFPQLGDPSLSGFTTTGNWSFLKWSVGIGATVMVLLFLFMRDTFPYPENTENRNALVPPFGESSLSRADSTILYPDSTKKSSPLK